MTVRTFHYAPLHNIMDWLALGWLPHDSLRGTHHGNYSVLVEWLCACPMVRPHVAPSARPTES